MAGEWVNATLGEVIELKRGYDLPASQRRPGAVPVVSSSGVSGTHSDAMVKGPGVVTGRYGTIGQVHYIRQDFWPLNTTLYVRDFKGADPRFVAYALSTLDFLAYSDKAAVPGVNRNDLHLARVAWPPLVEQRAIADLLGALDDKIDLNRRMADTLEAMARGLFKSWFVDFDPVRAKAGGRHVALPEDVAAHIPASFSSDGLPEGWPSEPLLVHATLLSGGTPKTEVPAYWGGEILWASAKDVSQCTEAFILNTERAITKKGLEESAAKIIPAYSTVVVARGATTGRFCMVGGDMAMNQTCYGLNSKFNRPFWLNCAFSEIVEPLTQAGHGSVFNTITTETLRLVQITAAPPAVLDRFEESVAPLFRRILYTIEGTRTLAALRETLLPRLISGELRIRDAENAIAAA